MDVYDDTGGRWGWTARCPDVYDVGGTGGRWGGHGYDVGWDGIGGEWVEGPVSGRL